MRAFDPAAALDGGPCGLQAHRAILDDLRRLLARGGVAVLEVGYDQAEAVGELACERGFAPIRFGADLGGNVRTLALRAPA